MIESLSNVACQLDVLLLVLADGDFIRIIKQDICGLKHRVTELLTCVILPYSMIRQLSKSVKISF